jgi:hypothetical protein
MSQNLDKILLNKIKSIIRNETGLGNERISTSEIYDKLISAGVEAEQSSVVGIIGQLEKEKLITLNRDDDKHEAYVITWVSGKL